MIDLRDMQLLAALARHEHFARAAEECGISQPAFSARIRNLEQSLGVPIVRRGNRFIGFTAEGERVLGWARSLLAQADGLRQDLESARGVLSGQLKIGVVPTALAFVAPLPAKLRESHSDLSIHIISASSRSIQRGLEDFSLDAGVTYLDGPEGKGVEGHLLYEERYVLLAPRHLAPKTTGAVTWQEAARLPLCLLTQDMQNRQILDATFARAGAAPQPLMETNSFTAAFAQVAQGLSATIAPESLARHVRFDDEAVILPLEQPDVTKAIGLVTAGRDPMPPAIRALLEVLNLPIR